MKTEPAIYLGRIVDKKHFRAFVYNASGASKLVESWDEFEAAMQSGVWFATQEDACSIQESKTKKKSRSKEVDTVEELIANIGKAAS
jgi:hypothetical protein